MKKCNNCNLQYEDDINYCKKCGEETQPFETKQEKEKREKNKKNTWKIIRYVIGSLIVFGSVLNVFNAGWYGLIGIVFGISLLPITYTYLNKCEKSNYILKNLKKFEILIPIVLGIIWTLLSPGEQLEKITINDNGHLISVNENYSIDFGTNLSKTNPNDYEYVLSDQSIATVKDGVIFGITDGKVNVTIKGKNGINATAEYIIKYVNLEAIEISGDTKLIVGESGKVKTILSPINSSDKIIKWISSNPDIVSIDNNGNIKAISKGTATITATSENGITQNIKVGSYIEIASMSISDELIKIEKGKTKTLLLTILPTDADSNAVNWQSSHLTIAKVENGIVTGLNEGKATITAISLNGVKTTAEVEVYEIKPDAIKLNKSNISLSVGDVATILASISPNNASDKSVNWYSSSFSVASIDNGVVTAKSRGQTTITATTSNGKTASIDVTVTEKSPIKLSQFSWSKDYVCGIQWTFSITNTSGKTINYITLKWHTLNSVGDFVYDQINGKNYVQVKYTGPLDTGRNTGKKVNSTKFYSCSYAESRMSEIKIDYADGTSKTILNSDFSEYTGLQ